MNRYHSIIFVTGGITLALELLASRILTPYFGVSLYIWSGILSITLVALAIGYWWGGRLAVRANREQIPRLAGLFALMPAVSSLSILLAALVYPRLFVTLAELDLVLGAFLACSLLLLVPLVTVSAMNPLLVGLSTARAGVNARGGDAGAGYVFFISTIGSVLGVLVTAFLFIPNVSNFRSLLILAIALALVSLYLAKCEPQLAQRQRKVLFGVSVVAGLAAVLLLVFADGYLGKSGAIVRGAATFHIAYEKPTFFGNIKIVDASIQRGTTTASKRLYFVDGLAQCVMLDKGEPGSPYTYAMESVGRGLNSKPRSVLVLGLGGGILPMRFAGEGVQIDVVEINPLSIAIAQEFFGYNRDVAQHFLEDARIYVRRCEKKYDLILADLFHGDSTPEYLLSAEFMSQLARCVTPGGGVVFNMVGHTDARFEAALYSYVKTVGSAWPNLRLFYPSNNKGICNLTLIASTASLQKLDPAAIPIPTQMKKSVDEILVGQTLDSGKLANATLLTDDYNVAAIQQAWCYLQTRIPVLRSLPAPLLVN